MLKIITIAGARPQFIKAAAINRAFRNLFPSQVTELIVHTGQHYDHNMSDVFFDELGIDPPAFRLGIGSSSHGKQTGEMTAAIEAVLLAEKPDCVIIYGDTNSTLAGALAASKIHIPVAHIEAGLRSFNKRMPEEINRILADHVSTFLFCPTQTGYDNLHNEGFKEDNEGPYTADNPRVYLCGDIMYDNSLYFAQVAEERHSDLFNRLGIEPDQYILATIHRNTNTDDPVRLNAIFCALLRTVISTELDILLPLHPRTAKMMETVLQPEVLASLRMSSRIKIIEPLSFLEVTLLESRARLIVTDSGGVQKEAYFFQKPGVVLRAETEWTELIEQGTCILADADEQLIVSSAEALLEREGLAFPPLFGDGSAAEYIVTQLVKELHR
ncbi:MAG: UDP-N-acetylglucosamine 2-epimerase (non-hydrolyzing) [Bacteroidota bacterium]